MGPAAMQYSFKYIHMFIGHVPKDFQWIIWVTVSHKQDTNVEY